MDDEILKGIIEGFNIVKQSLKNIFEIAVVASISIIILLTIINLTGLGTQLTSGESMEPSIPEECTLHITTENYTSLEDKIIIYDPIQPTNTKYITHRVIVEYKSYNPETAKYYINESGNFENRVTNQSWWSAQSQKNMYNLEGKTVYITQGDNTSSPDPELITKDQIKSQLLYKPVKINILSNTINIPTYYKVPLC